MRSPDLCRAASVALALALTEPAVAHAATHKFALSMMHFNVQYVAGGLQGFFSTPDPAIDLDAEQVEDSIIRQSFEPVLDLFLAHPTWGANMEMQGYMLDVMAARHPDVLDKLRTLAKAGRIEVVSFHYSDQIFLAYPREDWERSVTLDQATFAKHDVPLGKAVFCQEGQAGIGMASAMAAHGYETLVFPKNLAAYQHGDAMPLPLYRWGDVNMMSSSGFDWSSGGEDISVAFWFVDDGELLATGDIDPYIAEKFKKNPAAIAKREQELMDREANGFQIATVSAYVTAAKALVTPAEPPPLLDGTWQPNSTDGISRWLGGFGLWWVDERDNDVRSLGAMAHRELMAAETIAESSGIEAREELDGAWRLLALGQVTDATGINPFRGEVEYGIAHFTEVLRVARDVIDRGKEQAGARVRIDTGAGTVDPIDGAPAAPASIAPPFAVEVTSGDRTHEEIWSSLEEGHYVLSVNFGAGDDRSESVLFPGDAGDLVYTPGLLDAPVHVPRDAFVFDHFELALSDGLIGLASDRYVIKDQARVHVAARILPASGDVLFHDDTAPAGESSTWVFHVVMGTEKKATEVARRVNVTPELVR